MPTKRTRWTQDHESQRAGAEASASYQDKVLRCQIKLIREVRNAIRAGSSHEVIDRMLADAGTAGAEALAEAQAIIRLMEAAGRGR